MQVILREDVPKLGKPGDLVTFDARGLEVVTFNFPYTEARRRVPDPTGTLEACYHAVVAALRDGQLDDALFIGGKSLGGRIASHLAAQETSGAFRLSGLVFLGYPLHPPGRPAARRTTHWPHVKVPVLFVQGSRDTFGTGDEIEGVVPALGGPSEPEVCSSQTRGPHTGHAMGSAW